MCYELLTELHLSGHYHTVMTEWSFFGKSKQNYQGTILNNEGRYTLRINTVIYYFPVRLTMTE